MSSSPQHLKSCSRAVLERGWVSCRPDVSGGAWRLGELETEGSIAAYAETETGTAHFCTCESPPPVVTSARPPRPPAPEASGNGLGWV